MLQNPNPLRLVKEITCINQGGGKRKPTFKYTEDDDTTTRQVLILQKKTQKRCEEMKNEKNCKGGRREIKIKRFMRLNSPHKAHFRIEQKWSIMTKNLTVRVQKGTATSLQRWS